MIETTQLVYLLIWVAIGLVTFLVTRSRAWSGAGLALAFFVNMALYHWFGAVVSFLPWYTPVGGLQAVKDGFEISTLGMVGFAVGCFAIAPLLTRGLLGEEGAFAPPPSKRVFHIFLAVGFACYLGMALGLGAIPSATAVLFAGFNLILVAICIGLWHSHLERKRGQFILLVAATILLPLFTIVTQGFLGYGVGYAIVIVAFVVVSYRLRWRWLFVGLGLGYLALSFYVTYMRDRGDIRSAVWEGSGYEARFEKVQNIWRDFEWFDVFDKKHLEQIDWRLNQNWLVGAAVNHLEPTGAFANGKTIWMAALALVPRAIWPSKPVVAGSMGLVEVYSGIKVAEGTSIGMGLIFEFYANFQRYGVFFGLLLIGVLVGVADRKAGAALRYGALSDFVLWFLVGIVMQNVGGSLVEIAPALVASVLIALTIKRFLGSESVTEPLDSVEEQHVEPANR